MKETRATPRAWSSLFRAMPAHLILMPKIVGVMQNMMRDEVISNGELSSILKENRDTIIFACNLIHDLGWCERTHNAEGLIAWKPTDKLPTVEVGEVDPASAEFHLMMAAAAWGRKLDAMRRAA